MTAGAGTHIVLLRGINVGKHHRIAMADLRLLLTTRGYHNVRTLLNSGNAVVTADTDDPAAVARDVRAAISDEFGMAIHTVVRSRDDVARVIARNPLGPAAERDPKLFHVGFADPPVDAATFARIDQATLGADQVALDEGTLYCAFADGLHGAPLSKALSAAALTATVTLRNWNTVNKLVGLAAD